MIVLLSNCVMQSLKIGPKNCYYTNCFRKQVALVIDNKFESCEKLSLQLFNIFQMTIADRTCFWTKFVTIFFLLRSVNPFNSRDQNFPADWSYTKGLIYSDRNIHMRNTMSWEEKLCLISLASPTDAHNWVTKKIISIVIAKNRITVGLS